MKLQSTLLKLALGTSLAAASAFAAAQPAGTWQFGVGLHNVDPKSDNGTVDATALGLTVLPIDVDNKIGPTVTAEYFVADNLGVELLAALPFKHDISTGATKIGETKHLPPVVSLQYYLPSISGVQPFAGLGLNYTTFFSEKEFGPLVGTKLELDDSFGVALRLGADFPITQNGKIRADIRWIDINTDVSVNGSKIGEVEIDPLAYGLSYVWSY